jgi:alpha-galactosidase
MSLTQIEPVRSSGRWRGFEADEVLSGTQFQLGGKYYESGLKSFAGSEIEFELHGLYENFSALTGLSATSGTNAAGEFLVLGDGQKLWRSGTLRPLDEPKSVEIKISGVSKLILRTTGEGGRRNRAEAAWAEPKVSKQAR